jgi:hypothetical protein
MAFGSSDRGISGIDLKTINAAWRASLITSDRRILSLKFPICQLIFIGLTGQIHVKRRGRRQPG